MAIVKLSRKMADLLNQAIARELQVSIQYMWQHIVIRGKESAAIQEVLKETAVAEMKHAEAIGERLDYLGGTLTTKPAEIKVGKTLDEILKNDAKAEEEAIVMYKEIIRLADEEDDDTTKFLFEGILSDEEDHHNTFLTLLGR